MSKNMKNTWVATTVGLLLSTGMALSADLGGNCCSDLEERVAELETTTARKGNRRVSLTISGAVNRALMYWNDGGRSNTYFGLDNGISSTRLQFAGSGRISPNVTAGFSILFEVAGGGRAFSVTQRTEDDPEGIGSNQDHLVSIRDANWWIQSTQLGRLTVGRLVGEAPKMIIDVGGIGIVASGTSLHGTGLLFRNQAGTLTAFNIGHLWDNNSNQNRRTEGVHYTSPTFGGFTFAAHVGEAAKVERITVDGTQTNVGRIWGASLRYAAEFAGLRLAAAAGYENNKAEEVFAPSTTNPSDGTNRGLSLSLRHQASGLFAQAHYTEYQRTHFNNASNTISRDTTQKVSMIQAGIQQRFFPIGPTSLYGEYVRTNNGVRTFVSTAAGDVDSAMKVWGVGMVQVIDAAAMELYAGYRNYSADIGGAAMQDISLVLAGARIRF